ncbi:MAG: hypothetical protein EZS28_016123 [Streblomastix strix]|uniref:Uncharacterized protein n=1 Tax=Streblomastix strix TaxID=222440 RepID=A0A5J4W080_9EUKA|nr:MAG: hypothetical protein EZS28_016123 [Streblomastix strix]
MDAEQTAWVPPRTHGVNLNAMMQFKSYKPIRIKTQQHRQLTKSFKKSAEKQGSFFRSDPHFTVLYSNKQWRPHKGWVVFIAPTLSQIMKSLSSQVRQFKEKQETKEGSNQYTEQQDKKDKDKSNDKQIDKITANQPAQLPTTAVDTSANKSKGKTSRKDKQQIEAALLAQQQALLEEGNQEEKKKPLKSKSGSESLIGNVFQQIKFTFRFNASKFWDYGILRAALLIFEKLLRECPYLHADIAKNIRSLLSTAANSSNSDQNTSEQQQPQYYAPLKAIYHFKPPHIHIQLGNKKDLTELINLEYGTKHNWYFDLEEEVNELLGYIKKKTPEELAADAAAIFASASLAAQQAQEDEYSVDRIGKNGANSAGNRSGTPKQGEERIQTPSDQKKRAKIDIKKKNKTQQQIEEEQQQATAEALQQQQLLAQQQIEAAETERLKQEEETRRREEERFGDLLESADEEEEKIKQAAKDKERIDMIALRNYDNKKNCAAAAIFSAWKIGKMHSAEITKWWTTMTQLLSYRAHFELLLGLCELIRAKEIDLVDTLYANQSDDKNDEQIVPLGKQRSTGLQINQNAVEQIISVSGGQQQTNTNTNSSKIQALISPFLTLTTSSYPLSSTHTKTLQSPFVASIHTMQVISQFDPSLVLPVSSHIFDLFCSICPSYSALVPQLQVKDANQTDGADQEKDKKQAPHKSIQSVVDSGLSAAQKAALASDDPSSDKSGDLKGGKQQIGSKQGICNDQQLISGGFSVVGSGAESANIPTLASFIDGNFLTTQKFPIKLNLRLQPYYLIYNFAMDHARDYNVEGGLLSLGENIFLELLSEMELPQDVRQFLVLNKKTFKLILHPRYARIIQSIIQISPGFIIKEAWQGRSDGNKFFHSDKDDWCTIAIEPIISEGIVRIEVVFENTGGWSRTGIGFADASCSFATSKGPWDDGNRYMNVRYWGDNGDLQHITETKGNQKYADGQRVAVEVDMTIVPRRATFFVDDVEQPNFVIGIPEAIRFWVHTFYKSSFFTIIKFERLIQSTAKGVKGSNALEWGKKWK